MEDCGAVRGAGENGSHEALSPTRVGGARLSEAGRRAFFSTWRGGRGAGVAVATPEDVRVEESGAVSPTSVTSAPAVGELVAMAVASIALSLRESHAELLLVSVSGAGATVEGGEADDGTGYGAEGGGRGGLPPAWSRRGPGFVSTQPSLSSSGDASSRIRLCFFISTKGFSAVIWPFIITSIFGCLSPGFESCDMIAFVVSR